MAQAETEFLVRRGWDMSRPADVCHLDHSENVPGYRKVITGGDGHRREIILCPEDARALEAAAFDGDYDGAETPADSRAAEWPWMVLARAG
jgi:hypothetical protein